MSATTVPPPPPPPGASPLRGAGAVLALLAAGAQVLAAFQRWAPDGRVGLDVSLLTTGGSAWNAGTALLLLAALPAVAALVTDRGWPRAVSAVGTAALALWWVAIGPAGPLPAGVQLAAAAVCAHLFAAALAR